MDGIIAVAIGMLIFLIVWITVDIFNWMAINKRNKQLKKELEEARRSAQKTINKTLDLLEKEEA